MLIYVCVLITYYLFILVTLKAESLLIIVYSLSKSDDRQEYVFKYWWWENSQTIWLYFTNIPYIYYLFWSHFLITYFSWTQWNGPNQHLPHCRTEDVKHTHRTFLWSPGCRGTLLSSFQWSGQPGDKRPAYISFMGPDTAIWGRRPVPTQMDTEFKIMVESPCKEDAGCWGCARGGS